VDPGVGDDAGEQGGASKDAEGDYAVHVHVRSFLTVLCCEAEYSTSADLLPQHPIKLPCGSLAL
jgi:hypothetical protein